MLVQVRAETDPHGVIPGAVDLRLRIRGVSAAVAVASRGATMVMVALAAAGAISAHAYTSVPLALTTQGLVAAWSAVFVVIVLRRDIVPGWVLTVDVGVCALGMIGVAVAAQSQEFEYLLANPDLEPVTVSVAAAVALISASALRTTLSCAVMALGYGVAQGSLPEGSVDVLSNISVVGWQAGAGLCCYLFIRRLHELTRAVDTATAELVRARERLATRRAHTEERVRHFSEQVRRYRALHDGPLRILNALAGRGPAAHPDPEVRRQCAVSVNVLRGATPDEAGGSVTDLSLALIEAGNQSATLGLRVEYHFANLPDDLPVEVINALTQASGEALTNIANHAGVTRAKLTALAADPADRLAVTVAVVDQGKGFDPDTVELGYGIRHSIVDRLAEIGGEATVDSHLGQGTRIDLRWPA
jgi:signal transduction histidine kinase